MKLKNYLVGIIIIGLPFAFVEVTNAAYIWEPMVRIPGLPAGAISLSTYIVGLYNFLLSIVGIVAVMMLIVGGMRLITAAGNAAALTSGKEIISNALLGLVLALFSWVLISEINPDALYLKKPGSGFAASVGNVVGTTNNYCYSSFSPIPNGCVCGDGSTKTEASISACSDACETGGNCDYSLFPCTRDDDGSTVFNADTKCYCIDGEGDHNDVNKGPYVKPVFAGPSVPSSCEDVCTNPAFANDGEYHGINWDLRVGEDLRDLQSGERFTVTQGKTVYFDVSNIRDCAGEVIHIVADFDGDLSIWKLPDRLCCNPNKPLGGCGVSWGSFCYLPIPGMNDCDEESSPAFITLPILTIPPIVIGTAILTGNDMFPNPKTVWKHVYGAVSALTKPEYIWPGLSHQTADPGVCEDLKHKFQVDVIAP